MRGDAWPDEGMVGCIHSVDAGVLALWASVLVQAARDVGYGLRYGMISSEFAATEVRREKDRSRCREALHFLNSPLCGALCESVGAAGKKVITPDFLRRCARDFAVIPDVWESRPRLTGEEREAAREKMRRYQQEYHKAYKRRSRGKEAA